jgi:hypothetical protein
MLFGSRSDLNLFIRINRELLRDVIEQEILYYKISLSGTIGNIYGESLEKTYMIPSKLNCLVTRGDQVVSVDEFGPDLNRDFSFAFLRDDLVDIEVVPEIGDVIEWHNDFYLVDTVRENQLFLGKDNNYNLTDYGSKFGGSVSIIADCHLTRADLVGIRKVR